MGIENQTLLEVACKLGRGLLENGGEIYRVEESINFFLKAYGVEDGQIFAIPATIIVTINTTSGPITKIERIKSISQNMNKLHRINDLCRKSCSDKPNLNVVVEELDKILNSSPYPDFLQIIAYGVASGFFCLFWGGGIFDATIAFFCGVITKFCLDFMNKFKTNIFFSNLVCSMIIAFVASISFLFFKTLNVDKIIIGAIMTLVPGVAITNIMRDIIAGDIITGSTNLAQVLLVATSIAVGIALTLSALNPFIGGLI